MKTQNEIKLTEAQLREGYKRCIEHVQNLLDSAKLLLEYEDSRQYALGLYMYAIEEYGKAEILKSYFTENKSEYLIPEWIFGRGDFGSKAHNRKLSEGFKKLPPICRRLSRTIEITTYNSSDTTQTFANGSISVPLHLSGTFVDPSIPKRTVDFDLKTACFYIDWDNTNNTNGEWKFVLPVDKDQLTDNIERMKEAIISHKS